MKSINTVGELIKVLQQYPDVTKIEIVYETCAHRRIESVRQENLILQIIAENP